MTKWSITHKDRTFTEKDKWIIYVRWKEANGTVTYTDGKILGLSTERTTE